MKSYTDFLNENLQSQYCYYGAGSLYPLVAKLVQEGKSKMIINQYLVSLGVDGGRIAKVLEQFFPSDIEDVMYDDEEDEDGEMSQDQALLLFQQSDTTLNY